MSSRLLSMILCALMVIGRAVATPEAPRVLREETIIDFPVGVTFGVDTRIPTLTLAAVTLRIAWGDDDRGSQVTFTPDPVETLLIVDEPDARLRIRWRLPIEDAPRVFDALRYDWEITTDDGVTDRLAGTVVFEDPRVMWRTIGLRDDRVVVSLPAGRGVTEAALRPVVDLLTAVVGEGFSARRLVYPAGVVPPCTPEAIAADPDARASNAGVCDTQIAEQVYAGYGISVAGVGESSLDHVSERLIADAYPGVIANPSVPAWFRVGLTRFLTPTDKQSLLGVAQNAERTRALLPLAAMITPADDPIWAAQAYGMILYTAEIGTYEAVYRLARAAASGDDFAAIYRSIVGIDLDRLIPAWRAWLFMDAAASAYRLTPYQAPTLMPSPTRTSTATPPPSATATVTASPSPSATRRPPTATPPPTATLLPPSITPRPPGSLPTVTPAVISIDADGAGFLTDGGVGTAVVVLLVLEVILIGALIALTRRRNQR